LCNCDDQSCLCLIAFLIFINCCLLILRHQCGL